MMKWSHLFTSLVEALIVIAITQVPLWLGLLMHPFVNADATIASTLAMALQALSPADALGYSAGILGSSVGYAIMKISAFRARPGLMIALIILPFVVLFFASPAYVLDRNGAITNEWYANRYMATLIIASFFLWIFALYQSRAFFDVQLPSKSASNKIIREIEG